MVKIKKIEWTDEQIAALTDIQQILPLIALDIKNLPLLKEIQKTIQSAFNTYESMGFIDGLEYFENTEYNKALLKRLDAYINLLETLEQTNSVMQVKG